MTETDGETSVVLDTNLTPELIQEGFVREIISKVQTMRKEAGFEVMDKIIVYAKDNDRYMDIMKANQDEIKREVLAENIVLGEAEGYNQRMELNKEGCNTGSIQSTGGKLMIDKQFEKEEFKKSVKEKRKIPLSKNTGRGYTGADFSGCKLHCERRDH